MPWVSYLIVCFVSWSYTGAYLWLGGSVEHPYYPLFSVSLMWIPGLLSFLFCRYERTKLPLFRPISRTLLFAAIVPLLIGVLTSLLSTPFGIERSPREALHLLLSLKPLGLDLLLSLTASGLLFGALALGIAAASYTFAAFGEELYWRGYLTDKLQRFGFWKTCFVTGIAWGIWHWPIILMGHNYEGYPILGNLMMLLFTLAASPLLLYYRMQAGTVLGAAVFHAFLNIAGTASLIVFVNPNELYLDVEGVIGIAAISLVTAGILFWNPSSRLSSLEDENESAHR